MKKIKWISTWIEADFADQNELGGKIELDFEESSDALMKLDRHVARVLDDQVRHVWERHWFWRKLPSTYAEEHLCSGKYLQNELFLIFFSLIEI